MHWLLDLLLALLEGRREDRSVVGKSRLDEETSRFWTWVTVAALVICTVIWLITRT